MRKKLIAMLSLTMRLSPELYRYVSPGIRLEDLQTDSEIVFEGAEPRSSQPDGRNSPRSELLGRMSSSSLRVVLEQATADHHRAKEPSFHVR